MRNPVIRIIGLATLAFNVSAGQPQLQAGDAPLKGGLCFTKNYIGQDTIFECEYIGQVTIRQIYEKGWRVAHRMINTTTGTSFQWQSLIIEEQRK